MYGSRPWGFEAVLMAVLLEHEKRIERLRAKLGERRVAGHQPPSL